MTIAAQKPAAASRGTIGIAGLTVKRAGRTILEDINFEIAAGGITALVGPNGCGKSTLMKAVAQILPATAGQIAVDGVPLAHLSAPDVARRLAMLPQSPLLPEGMRVRDLVAQGRHPYRGLLRQWSPRDDDAIARAMADTNIEDLAERPLAALSGGQRQRCWIAMTLAQETGIILLDEPTTYLDLAVQIDIMRLLKRLAAEGRTIVAVLHELNLAAAFADRIVMMKAGRIVADGVPRDAMTEGQLAAVFGVDAKVIADPETGHPVCLPRSTARPA
ncbi:ABC transporter ATP-binding protein [Roseovarius sp. S1116L3]|uniref:ABC transporter ATP-binding protein n=1 Tax=Roseovarius roseus TaxID=3342636 RepID=UPI00372A538E